MKLGVRGLKSANSQLLSDSRPNSPASRRLVKEAFWPSRLTVRAASGSDLSSAPCAPVGAKTQLTRTPSKAGGSVLLSTCFSRGTPNPDHSGLECPPRGHPALADHARGFSLPALSHRLFPRSTRLSWAQPLRPPLVVGAGESEEDPAAQVLAPAGVGRLHGLPTSRAGPRKVLGTGIPESKEHGGGPGHGGDSCFPSGEGLRD